MSNLEQEKKLIRALLQSVKFGLTQFQLWEDYSKLIGKECHYQKYGFSSFNELLTAIPDTVRFGTHKGQTVVVAVVTAETVGIAKMVASQRTARKGSNCTLSNRSRAKKDRVTLSVHDLEISDSWGKNDNAVVNLQVRTVLPVTHSCLIPCMHIYTQGFIWSPWEPGIPP